MISIKLNRKNPGALKGFSKRLEALAGKEVAVGFPRGESGLGNPHYKNGASILLVAVANNYGLGVPRRAFMELAAEKIRKWFPRYMRTAMPDAEAGKVPIEDVLENAGLACAFFQVDTFADYAFMMEQLCAITGREDLYEENVTQVGQQIEEVQANAALSSTRPNVLLIRAFSTGIKAKTDDELAGAILKDLGAHNIADDHPSMLEDLSLEEVIAADPDYIFVTTMGDEQKALDYLNGLIQQNPAWSELSAVKEDRYIVLPKDLFHYKPNNRWGESYQYLGEILYPQLFHEE